MKKLIFAAIGMMLLVVFVFACTRSKTNATMNILTTSGVSGIAPNNILREVSIPAVNKDYRNALCFALLSFNQEQFMDFVHTNGFTREEVISAPSRSASWPKMPEWWDVSEKDMRERYLKRSGNTVLIVFWTRGQGYLYASD